MAGEQTVHGQTDWTDLQKRKVFWAVEGGGGRSSVNVCRFISLLRGALNDLRACIYSSFVDILPLPFLLKEDGQELVGIYSQNTKEWLIAAQGAWAYSMCVVPLYDTLGPQVSKFASIVEYGNLHAQLGMTLY